ncbi:uncharacterized protein MYCFIDRAFT_179701 [Pseudocercospora fijiensis CIRAD86]|uniref:Uncharacterized protein n=1 Tax=Pseudocercospora fijiensis (strain CIRAD86) TaxID=383855 RepID=M3AJ29_PSEFD|nr:uncharacterized protein MYCFIDRAFT_179701 [Pseudocercospora fijiensis CIRAD86]EME77487.1 hypothetical protein MYCFIDRAFT_179701 [Pseudocercospora fijiensis CIRAD86]
MLYYAPSPTDASSSSIARRCFLLLHRPPVLKHPPIAYRCFIMIDHPLSPADNCSSPIAHRPPMIDHAGSVYAQWLSLKVDYAFVGFLSLSVELCSSHLRCSRSYLHREGASLVPRLRNPSTARKRARHLSSTYLIPVASDVVRILHVFSKKLPKGAGTRIGTLVRVAFLETSRIVRDVFFFATANDAALARVLSMRLGHARILRRKGNGSLGWLAAEAGRKSGVENQQSRVGSEIRVKDNEDVQIGVKGMKKDMSTFRLHDRVLYALASAGRMFTAWRLDI